MSGGNGRQTEVNCWTTGVGVGDRQRDNACSREGKVFFFSFFLVFSFRISNFYLGIRIFIIIFSFLIPNFFILGLGRWPVEARGYSALRFNLGLECKSVMRYWV